MIRTVIASDCIVSPIGIGSDLNWLQIEKGITGIGLISLDSSQLQNFYAAKIGAEIWMDIQVKSGIAELVTKLESMFLAGIKEVEPTCPLPLNSPKTAFIISTTKGNIDLLSNPAHLVDAERVNLLEMSRFVTQHFNNPNEPFVVSNACISGVSAILLANTLIQSGSYEQVVVCGGDILSSFTSSGFNCLQAISPFPCRPFDVERAGLSPGEAVGVLVLVKEGLTEKASIFIAGGTSSNDANHISGPSRTGAGLAFSIHKTLKNSGLNSSEIDFISCHGTATLYNDESEAMAIESSGLGAVPLNSFKGHYGHTFGASGVIETILTSHSMLKNRILPSFGYSNHGVTSQVNVAKSVEEKAITHSLKTASGFGGCNASLILSKI